MRVVNSTTYRNFTTSVNDVHSKLNKAMNKVSSGNAYESAAENSLAYYQGQKLDSQYQDLLTKQTLITDVKARIDQQSTGAYSIQTTLNEAKTKLQYIRSGTNNNSSQVTTIRNDLLQKEQSIVNDLNGKYQNFYIFGGNDVSTSPFSLSEDGRTLTYSHQFPGDADVTEIKLQLNEDGSGFKFNDDDMDKILNAMLEEGRVDVGYGSIENTATLMNTYTSGLNVLIGLTSDTLKSLVDSKGEGAAKALIQERLNTSPIAVIGNAVIACDTYTSSDDSKAIEDFTETIGTLIDKASESSDIISTIYSDFGNKYSLLEDLDEKLGKSMDSLTEQYTELLGADTYEAITEMYSYQYSYNAALKMGSQMMQSSLFDYLA